jgi:hypothetical protein
MFRHPAGGIRSATNQHGTSIYRGAEEQGRQVICGFSGRIPERFFRESTGRAGSAEGRIRCMHAKGRWSMNEDCGDCTLSLSD